MKIHKSADVSKKAKIGEGTIIWNNAQVRESAQIGKNCVLAKNVYVDKGVIIGDNCKIQNNVSVFYGVIIEDGVFIGPHVCFTNDKNPRAVDAEGNLLTSEGWSVSPTLVKAGASVGANSTIVCGVTIGENAVIGAGSVVTKDVPD